MTTIKYFLFTTYSFLLSIPVFAFNDANSFLLESDFKNIAEKFIPAEMTNISDNIGRHLRIGSGIGVSFVQGSLDFKAKTNYLVIAYRATDEEKGDLCKLVVVKIDGKSKYTLMGDVVPKADDNYGSCGDLKIVDLDKHSSKQVLLSASAGKSSNDYHLFQWDGSKLIDITPIEKNAAGFSDTVLSDIKIFSNAGLGNPMVVNTPYSSDALPGDHLTRVYQMKNGQLLNIGKYDFFQILEKKSEKPLKVATLNPSFSAEGTYTLEVKNISEHNRAVRAEMTVNGSVVLKPQDFCQAPPPKKNDKDYDGDDDKDEDHMRGCKPKQDVYAIVNMKTANEIKVKLYGRGDSVVQLSLIKKP